ncbi:WD domain, G-beta repeat [Gemmata sp. SH-PL17]|uniref:c-type cytochrome domain-containing protein n=1 Tax=Gemmata sp. SH-PL17 TaxID=1630693 RepID=UPI00078D9701|nr:c-type cytochrome domain-containing protein [Gemmata sp. SH-PL17]AMV26186.1 WD domain, G-beta repeat [Gemmata sp. SH-PL17]
MTLRPCVFLLLALVIHFLSLAALPARADEKVEDAKVTFDGQVRPILAKRCGKCHNAERPRGELDLSSYAAVMLGGVSGRAVVEGKPDSSPLYTMTAHLEDPKMPPNSPKIPQTEIDTLRKWIEGGLVEKVGGAASTKVTPTPAPKNLDGLGKVATLARLTPVTALAVSPNALIVAVPGKKQVLLYELPSGKSLGALAFPEGEVHVLRFSRDGKVLLAAGGVGGQSGAVVGYDVASWKRQFAVADENEAVLAADISADKSRVVFGGPSRLVKVVSVPDGKIVHTFRKPTDWVLSVGFSPEGLLVAAGDRFGGLYVWETKSGKEFYTLRGHTKGVTGIAWRADSDALATSSDDQTVRVWNMHTGTEIAKWEAHEGGASDVAFHTSGVIVTAGRDGRVKLWDEKGKRAAEFGPADDAVLKVAFTADAKTVLSGDWAGAVRTWAVAGGTSVKLALPVETKPAALAAIPVPTPNLPVAAVRPTTPGVPSTVPANLQAELARKRTALKAVEDAAEKLKDEAARSPKNPALAKAYLQLCEAALAMKAEVVEVETAITKAEEKK